MNISHNCTTQSVLSFQPLHHFYEKQPHCTHWRDSNYILTGGGRCQSKQNIVKKFRVEKSMFQVIPDLFRQLKHDSFCYLQGHEDSFAVGAKRKCLRVTVGTISRDRNKLEKNSSEAQTFRATGTNNL